MKTTIVIILAIAIIGCQEVSDITISIDDPISVSGEYSGNVTITLADGQIITGYQTFQVNIQSETPLSEDSLFDLEIRPNTQIDTPESPRAGKVWITPSGTKYHWVCRYTGAASGGKWMTEDEAKTAAKAACRICLGSGQPVEDK